MRSFGLKPLQLDKGLVFFILPLKAVMIHYLRSDDGLHVLLVHRVVRDAVSTRDKLELLAAKQGFVHSVAAMVRADWSGASHSTKRA
jgi:hypothetical protein